MGLPRNHIARVPYMKIWITEGHILKTCGLLGPRTPRSRRYYSESMQEIGTKLAIWRIRKWED